MRILFVYAHGKKVERLQQGIKSVGWYAYHTDLGAEAIDLGKLYDYQAIVMDQRVDDATSGNITKELRDAGITTPILIAPSLTTSIDVRVELLRIGVDVCILDTDPPELLVAYITALHRRITTYNKEK